MSSPSEKPYLCTFEECVYLYMVSRGYHVEVAEEMVIRAEQAGLITQMGDDSYDITEWIKHAAMQTLEERREARRRLEMSFTQGDW